MANYEFDQIINSQVAELLTANQFSGTTSPDVEKFWEYSALIQRAKEAIFHVSFVEERGVVPDPIGNFRIAFATEGVVYDAEFSCLASRVFVEDVLTIRLMVQGHDESVKFVNREYSDKKLFSKIVYRIDGELLSPDPEVNKREALRMIADIERFSS